MNSNELTWIPKNYYKFMGIAKDYNEFQQKQKKWILKNYNVFSGIPYDYNEFTRIIINS